MSLGRENSGLSALPLMVHSEWQYAVDNSCRSGTCFVQAFKKLFEVCTGEWNGEVNQFFFLVHCCSRANPTFFESPAVRAWYDAKLNHPRPGRLGQLWIFSSSSLTMKTRLHPKASPQLEDFGGYSCSMGSAAVSSQFIKAWKKNLYTTNSPRPSHT